MEKTRRKADGRSRRHRFAEEKAPEEMDRDNGADIGDSDGAFCVARPGQKGEQNGNGVSIRYGGKT
ncbi:hypothetical protein SDC9_205584 [bioreactor metagenome]|uniref:Uncharacterized protein n=1 Tax=bioreactor metagenome TaxID=1076179 RepID=A0A645J2H4_9ZZZZ